MTKNYADCTEGIFSLVVMIDEFDASRCTSNDLRMVIRLIKHDLRINAGPRHILEGVHQDAYAAYQSTRDLASVVTQVLDKAKVGHGAPAKGKLGPTGTSGLSVGIKLMTPVLPMLAESCKSVEHAMTKCPDGMYADIKYDGERVQVHKKGKEFKYFSRSLKPVVPHKVNHFKDFIPKAFPSGEDMILDSEVLLVDTKTGKPLPFGTLGKHKQTAFKDATVCLFVFDCIYYNGEDLTKKPLCDRRKTLESVMVEVPNHVVISEMEEIDEPEQLTRMIEKVIRLGLEGLVLKSVTGKYEPGKRHWLKVKKDSLADGAMADTADLLVLGAWYGMGQKGGMMSVFLMGCYDPGCGKWKTVTKVHTGHDDATLERLQNELDEKMEKIDKNPLKIPSWLVANKQMYPDFVARDPKEMPVWEISGSELTQNVVHTADGISVRFPRVRHIRDDKTWDHATNLPELKDIFKKSKQTQNFTLAAPSSLTGSPRKAAIRSPAKKAPPAKPAPQSSKVDSDEELPPFTVKSEAESPKYDSDGEMRESDTPEKKSPKVDSPKAKKQAGTSRGISKLFDVKMEPKEAKGIRRPASSPREAELPKKRARKNGPEKPLPDIFVGARLSLPGNIPQEDRDVLRRYVVAYGGKILDESDAARATHILHDEKSKAKCDGASRAHHVKMTWLWTSIRLQKLLDVANFDLKCSS